MPTVVDGDNLLGGWAGRSRSDGERRLLVRQVRRLALAERRRIVIVFDGPEPPVRFPGQDVIFSGPGRSADTAILEIIRADRDPAGWTVVTDDKSLGDQARWKGASVERCRSFRARLVPERKGEKPEPGADIDEWLRIFGEGDEPT